MKIDERGRAKFRPANDYSSNDVKQVLMEKIKEESSRIIQSNKDEDIINSIEREKNKFHVVSLFSGCGGLDLGFELAGLVAKHDSTAILNEIYKSRNKYKQLEKTNVFQTIYSNDLFKESARSYKQNFDNDTTVQDARDIRNVKYFPYADVILGGFPCPGFSAAGPRLIDDERNFLYIHFIRAIIQARPKVFVAENVKGLLTLGKGEVAKQIIEDFASAGYKIQYKLVNSRDYGVPQLRERVFIVGVREDVKFTYVFPEPTHGANSKPYVTLKEAIGDLPEWPEDVYEGDFSSIYLSRNRKKGWNDQAFTVQASGRQAQLWPGGEAMQKLEKDKWSLMGNKNRRLSVRESARIQTFPDWWIFDDGRSVSISSKNNHLDKQYKQIGNAVPVLLARAVLQPIADWAKKEIDRQIEVEGQQPQLTLDL
ncbi:DNA cytosine methyltransferase [Exiguobacterium sp. s50]|uniref:DNA cytosine methyltransferase n=1 Tax=Exiguobacterium sp. s50 TaxID=2751234 RepID=UPI001BE89FE6|nr:DNA cytosine methyltransferase [Exiguobacterium sp. s50]